MVAREVAKLQGARTRAFRGNAFLFALMLRECIVNAIFGQLAQW